MGRYQRSSTETPHTPRRQIGVGPCERSSTETPHDPLRCDRLGRFHPAQPKPLARTTGIMRAMLTRTTDYGPTEPAKLDARYAQIVYLVAPAAISIVTR